MRLRLRTINIRARTAASNYSEISTHMESTKMKCLITIATFGAMLAGCTSMGRNYLPDEIMIQGHESGAPDYITKNGMIDLSKVNFESLDGPSHIAERQRFAASLITLSDQKCDAHKSVILSNSTNWNVGTGVLSILFSGYASVAKGASDAANAAAAAAATTGIQGQVNQEVYQGKISNAIIRAIDVARTRSYAPIAQHLTEGSYTASQLVLEINRYHSACSLMTGLSELTNAIENRPSSTSELTLKINLLESKLKGGALDKSTIDAINNSLTRLYQELATARD